MPQNHHHPALQTLFVLLILFTSLPLAAFGAANANAFVAPINKDSCTSLYTIALNSTRPYLIDLAGPVVWGPCPKSYNLVQCTAPICTDAAQRSLDCPVTDPYRPPGFCRCTASVRHPITGKCFSGNETVVPFYLSATDGTNPTYPVSLDYVNICAPEDSLKGLPHGAVGIAGFGRTDLVSLPARIAWDIKWNANPSFYNQFALCLPSTPDAPGVAFFGDKPYRFLPSYLPDVSTFLTYTTLVRSPLYSDVSYFLDVKGLAINGVPVSVPTQEHAIDSSAGRGGVKLSTTIPYTAMRSSIYKPFIEAYKTATSGYKNMPAVEPFDLCFDTRALGSTRVGYAVPPIDVMLNDGKNWTVFGVNSIKDVESDTACLAFVDGGEAQAPAIAIGGFQLEDAFLHFDVVNLTLGFVPTLRGLQTTCSNFNFTSVGY